jgi:hypothetical protein
MINAKEEGKRKSKANLHVHSSSNTHAVQHVDHIFSRYIASSTDGVGTAPEARYLMQAYQGRAPY